jgi:hypothetical protein
MRETVLLKNLRVPDKNILLDANPDTGASIHIHGNVKINANLDSSFDENGDAILPQFPPDNDTCPYMHKESIQTTIDDVSEDFKVIKQEDATPATNDPSSPSSAEWRNAYPYYEVGIALEEGTVSAEGGNKGFILLEEATNGD